MTKANQLNKRKQHKEDQKYTMNMLTSKYKMLLLLKKEKYIRERKIININ